MDYRIVVTPRNRESLSPLVHRILDEIPDLREVADEVDILREEKPLFGGGNEVVTGLAILWRTVGVNESKIRAYERVLKIIRDSGYGDVELIAEVGDGADHTHVFGGKANSGDNREKEKNDDNENSPKP